MGRWLASPRRPGAHQRYADTWRTANARTQRSVILQSQTIIKRRVTPEPVIGPRLARTRWATRPEYADLLERSKRGSESNENFCFRNLRRNNIWRHGSLSQRT